MCGIFGIIGNKEIDNGRFLKASEAIRHRGPDDEGYLLLNSVMEFQLKGTTSPDDLQLPLLTKNSEIRATIALAHRRLSILDLSSAGHQPMSYDSGNLWITFNGEIYNYLEIRKELLSLGYEFRTLTDTEVILAAYHKWGTDCVSRFNGMWAFAIFDKKEQLVFLSRDRFGEKPLFYHQDNDQFIFCSEIKGIKTYLDCSLNLNKEQLVYFCYEGQTKTGNTEQTIFEEISQLQAGHNLILKNGVAKISRYWEIKLQANRHSFKENVEIFKMLFFQSLKYRLRSDVEVGTCLSGGIDSSSIVSFGSHAFNRKFHTFSAVWPGEPCDEERYIKLVNQKWNCNANPFTPQINIGLDDFIGKITWHMEQPVAGSSVLAQWAVMEKARERNISVLLDGQGADEVLGGYPDYMIPYLNEMLFGFHWFEILKNYNSLRDNNYSLKRMAGIQKNRIFAKKKPLFALSRELNNSIGTSKKFYSYTHLSDYLKFDIEERCLPNLLLCEDRNSMAHSVESRTPFLDHQLVEFCINIPSKHKITGPVTKMVLREAMKDYLPSEIYERRDKNGFETPLEKNLQNGNAFDKTGFIKEHFKTSRLRELNIFDPKEFDEPGRLQFKLYCLSRFYEMWVD